MIDIVARQSKNKKKIKEIKIRIYKQNNFFRCYDCLHKKAKRTYGKIISNNKIVQQCVCKL